MPLICKYLHIIERRKGHDVLLGCGALKQTCCFDMHGQDLFQSLVSQTLNKLLYFFNVLFPIGQSACSTLSHGATFFIILAMGSDMLPLSSCHR